VAKEAKAPDTIKIVVSVPPDPDDNWTGFWSAGVFWANGETRATVAPEVLSKMLIERELHRGAWRCSVIRYDTGELFAPLPPLDRRSDEERFEADRARADAIERRKARVAAEERERRAQEAEVRAANEATIADIEERRRAREADRERIARVLAEEDAAIAEKAKAANEAAEKLGIWRDVIRKTAP
jgi:hypothetical protein